MWASSSTPIDSLYNIEDWASAPSPLSIANVVVEASCLKMSGAAVDVRIIIKSGGTTSVGATAKNCRSFTPYTVWTETWTTDPATSSAWTLSALNSLQIGVRDNTGSTKEVRASHVKATVTFAPVYSVEIDKCTNEVCSSYVTLYGPTNGNTYGQEVTFTTGNLGMQTFGANERIRFRVTLETSGSVTVRYNGASGGTDDSRGTVPIPEFQDLVLPAMGIVFVVLVCGAASRRRRRVRPSASR